jgi:hypothetical protein
MARGSLDKLAERQPPRRKKKVSISRNLGVLGVLAVREE